MRASPSTFSAHSLPDDELIRLIAGEPAVRSFRACRSLRALSDPSFASSSRALRKLLAAREFVARGLAEELHHGPALSTPNTVRELLRLRLEALEHEEFWALFLDTQHRLLAAESLFRGTLTQTSVYPREVVKRALHHNSAAVFFAHNHPSAAPDPSAADRALTRTLREALALVDVRVLDHFIVAGSKMISFSERGLL